MEKKTYLDAKSIHIYAWPFTFEGRDSFLEQLQSKGWERKESDFLKVDGSREALQDAYMLKQYLSKSAQKIFLDSKDELCGIYEYDLDPFGDGKKYYYRITTKEKTYELLLAGIELHVYKKTTGVLFLRALNMDENSTVADIKMINEKGRSISIPFIPDTEDGYMLCPENLSIVAKVGDEVLANEVIVTDFRARIQKIFQSKTGSETSGSELTEAKRELERNAEFLEYVLNINLDKKGTNTLKVTPNNDYRMFVISMIRDAVLSRKLADPRWRESEKGERELYALLYVDENKPTCQHAQMRRSLLEEAGYFRWADEGTVYGATEYSFLCITTDNPDVNAPIVRPFYVEYAYMISLVLAQKIGLSEFIADSEELAKKMENGKVGYWSKAERNALLALQEKYTIWKNSMMIPEFSEQQQGMELYHLFQRQLHVDREGSILDDQLQSMYEMVNVSHGSRIETWGFWIAIIAVLIELTGVILELI